jgi:hypothetical protein
VRLFISGISSSRLFAKDKFSCRKNRLIITAIDYLGEIFDKAQNKGYLKIKV